MECKDCCKEISKVISSQYKGYCKSCYNEKFEKDRKNSDINIYHRITLIYAFIVFIFSIISGYMFTTGYNEFNISLMFTILFIDFLSSFLFYMLGSIIEELRRIK